VASELGTPPERTSEAMGIGQVFLSLFIAIA
jgi:hypothetical protein